MNLQTPSFYAASTSPSLIDSYGFYICEECNEGFYWWDSVLSDVIPGTLDSDNNLVPIINIPGRCEPCSNAIDHC